MAGSSLQNIVTRAVITALDTAKKCQAAGLKLIAGEQKENVEHLEPYGFTSAAQNGAEAVMLFQVAIARTVLPWWLLTAGTV